MEIHSGILSSTPKKQSRFFTDFFPDSLESFPSPVLSHDQSLPPPIPNSSASIEGPNASDKKMSHQWIPELFLYQSDREILLNPDGWLSDSIIDAGQALIKKVAPIPGMQNVYLTTAFSIETHEFIQVLNNGNHWLLISTINETPPNVLVYDSAYASVNTFIKEQIATLLHTKEKEICLKFVNTQMQNGAVDCGLFAIAFATAIAFGYKPELLSFDQNKMRKHLLSCLTSGEIRMFPEKEKRQRKSIIKNIQKIKVYCYCRLPKQGEMIQCHHCKEWFHLSTCVHVVDKKAEWLCNCCI